jgi:hypothetical protein
MTTERAINKTPLELQIENISKTFIDNPEAVEFRLKGLSEISNPSMTETAMSFLRTTFLDPNRPSQEASKVLDGIIRLASNIMESPSDIDGENAIKSFLGAMPINANYTETKIIAVEEMAKRVSCATSNGTRHRYGAGAQLKLASDSIVARDIRKHAEEKTEIKPSADMALF